MKRRYRLVSRATAGSFLESEMRSSKIRLVSFSVSSMSGVLSFGSSSSSPVLFASAVVWDLARSLVLAAGGGRPGRSACLSVIS